MVLNHNVIYIIDNYAKKKKCLSDRFVATNHLLVTCEQQGTRPGKEFTWATFSISSLGRAVVCQFISNVDVLKH